MEKTVGNHANSGCEKDVAYLVNYVQIAFYHTISVDDSVGRRIGVQCFGLFALIEIHTIGSGVRRKLYACNLTFNGIFLL